MTKMTLLNASLIPLLLVACATSNKKTSTTEAPITKSAKVIEMEKKKKEREEALQDQKDRHIVMKKKSEMQGSSIPMRANPQNKRIEILSSNEKVPQNDRQLYSELVGSYDRNNEIAFFSRFQAFLKHYPKSPLVDDSIYLAGLMSLSNKNYGPALRYFNQVLKQHPLSNKASASLFAKGVALKKLNLTEESRQAFLKVQKSYPGSPEALRAQTELKLINR